LPSGKKGILFSLKSEKISQKGRIVPFLRDEEFPFQENLTSFLYKGEGDLFLLKKREEGGSFFVCLGSEEGASAPLLARPNKGEGNSCRKKKKRPDLWAKRGRKISQAYLGEVGGDSRRMIAL